MKILFVCGSLEPGRDGVGDYTARIAEELAARGHECAVIAINDWHVADNSIIAETLGWQRMRLSVGQTWPRRIEILRKETASFQPDWVSLQFVAHGFHPKGLPLLLPSRLSSIGGGFNWQIMFHELWVEPRGRWSNHIISRLQKFLLGEICRKLQPKVVHTSNPYYASRLKSAGIRCGELPLFGNIPFVQQECPHRADEWVFVFFGSLRRGWDPEPLLCKIEAARAAAGKKTCRFVSIGRLGDYGDTLWEQMEKSGYEKFIFEKRGELPTADISRTMQSADFGISVSPFHLLGKSGAVAAMREHGLPVIVNHLIAQNAQEGPACQDRGGSRKHTDAALTSRALLTKRVTSSIVLMDENFEKNLTDAKRVSVRETLPEVAEQFLKDLERVS